MHSRNPDRTISRESRADDFVAHLRQRAPAGRQGSSRLHRGFVNASARGEPAQCGFEWLEPGVKVPPLADPLPVNGLPHLLGTRGPDTALGLVELETRRLKVQADEVENPANVVLEVLDQLFVLHAQNLPGKYRVPVRHELDVSAVITADVLKAVSELLARGEQLLEVAEAAGHRLAPSVDYSRVWQDQVDQPDVPEVVRHLVDEIGLVSPIDLCIGKELLPVTPQLLCSELRQDQIAI